MVTLEQSFLVGDQTGIDACHAVFQLLRPMADPAQALTAEIRCLLELTEPPKALGDRHSGSFPSPS